MRRAIGRLGGHDHVLVDGLRIADFEAQVGPYTSIVDGDARVYSIACASIIAKTVRDRMMHNLALRYPEYGWDRNAGYATREHRDAIRAHGLTPHHRTQLAGDPGAARGGPARAVRRRGRDPTDDLAGDDDDRRARLAEPGRGRPSRWATRETDEGDEPVAAVAGATLAVRPRVVDKSPVSRARHDLGAMATPRHRPGAGRRRGAPGGRAAGRGRLGGPRPERARRTGRAGPGRRSIPARRGRWSSWRCAGAAVATSGWPRSRSTTASAWPCGARWPGCSDAGILPDGTPLPRLPVRIDLVAIDRGPDGRPSIRHHRGLRP